MRNGIKVDVSVPELKSRDFQELAFLYGFGWYYSQKKEVRYKCRSYLYFYLGECSPGELLRMMRSGSEDEIFLNSELRKVTSLKEAEEWFESLPKLETEEK